jgi:delta14-sterol reductase
MRLTTDRLGAFGITVGLPIACYAAGLICNDVTGCPATSILHPFSLTLDKLKADVGWKGISTLFTWQAFIANLGWYFLSLVLYRFLPATEAEGIPLRGGGKLNYRFNGTSIHIM